MHYVVPVGPEESTRDSSNDFKEIYISTPSSGLQRVERNASSASSSVTTSRSSKSSSPSSSRDDQCCQMTKFDPFLSLDRARVEGGRAIQILQRSAAEP